jgi:hypothetical protein
VAASGAPTGDPTVEGAAAAAGAVEAPAGDGSGWPTLAISSGWISWGHSAATAGSMFQRRNFVLSTWNRR